MPEHIDPPEPGSAGRAPRKPSPAAEPWGDGWEAAAKRRRLPHRVLSIVVTLALFGYGAYEYGRSGHRAAPFDASPMGTDAPWAVVPAAAALNGVSKSDVSVASSSSTNC